ncbi:MAG: chromate transporter [Oscillospiraceae bacterium]|nr:chromate transporter [Oscillospiraceae bacterium]
MILLELLAGFLLIGCFSFGGAYSAIPLIREVVLMFGWLDEEKLSYMIAVSESTPGPIMVNLATYIGSSKAGVFGAIIATAAVILPAFLLVIVLITFLKDLIKKDAVQAVLDGLKSCVIGIILATGLYMILINCIGSIDGLSVDIAAVSITAGLSLLWFGSKFILKKGFSPIILIFLSGIAGVLIYGWS